MKGLGSGVFLKIAAVGVLAAVVILAMPQSTRAATVIPSNTYYTDFHWTLDGSPYIIDGFVYLRMGSLTIDPGVVIKFKTATSSLMVHADTSFISRATKDNPIYFTSYKDDAHGGDTNGDGNATAPAPGDWGHLSIACGASISGMVPDYIRVYYGGASQDGEQYPGALHICFEQFGFPSGLFKVSNIEVAHNLGGLNIGATVFGGSISGFSIHDNVDYGVYVWRNYGATASLRGNWWGSPAGPRSPDNPLGLGDLVITGGDMYLPTDGWLTEDPLAITAPPPPPPPKICSPGVDSDCNDNVLFLPGIEASRLYRPDYNGGTDQLWEPQSDSDVQDLYMTQNGSSSRNDVYTKEGAVLDEEEFNGVNVYKSFIARMNDLKATGKIVDWKAAAYDWRLSLDDILSYGNNIDGRLYYSGDLRATTTPYIVQELRRLAATSRTGKVTIVAHSNGGLVAKRLTQVLGPESSTLIDKIIFVAVPQAGTPAAIAAGEQGYDQALGSGLILDKQTARTFAQNAPTDYQLMPSAQYFTWVDDPVVSFDASLPDWIARYGAAIHSAAALHSFLTDSFGRVNPTTGNIDAPVQMNTALLSNAEALHTSLDNWTPPGGVKLIQVAGWGVPTTVTGITYQRAGTSSITYTAQTTVDGDGTVVVPSALWVSTTTPGVENYWVDLNQVNRIYHKLETVRFFDTQHADILEVRELGQFISDNLSNSAKPISDYIYLFTQAPASTENRLHFTLHSPLTLDAYDDLGHHTGISTTTGRLEEQIPGAYYAAFGETKQLFADTNTPLHIIMNGYAAGSFALNADELQGDSLVTSATFKDIPTTAKTVVTIGTQSDLSSLSPMQIDTNGDGTVDATIVPKIGGIVSLDTTPPELQITFSTSTNALAFIGTDESGPVVVTATTSYPVLKKGQKEYKGMATTTVTARDTAGNTTALIYTEQLPSPNQRDTILLQSVAYNGATSTIPNTNVSYKWRLSKDNSYKLFASFIRTTSTSTESHYRPKKNQTIVMTRPVDLDDTDEDDSADNRPTRQVLLGMVVPYARLQKGKVIIGY